MKIVKLSSHLQNDLKAATGVYIASAIVSDNGLKYLLDNIQEDCKAQLLIGIDLPTPDSVFQTLLNIENTNIEAKAFTKTGYFHPKLYLIDGPSKVVYIGSGNFTDGGLGGHIELFHKIEDGSVFNDYLSWFNQYYKLGQELKEDWINEYAKVYNERKDIDSEDRQKLGNFKKRLNGIKPLLDLRKVDFTNQFFKLEHYLAFEGDKPSLNTPTAIKERIEVRDRLLDLHDILNPMIISKRWDIHPHAMEGHITSSYQHGEYTAERLTAMWLHYGRSQPELDKFRQIYGDKQSSLYHMRLQVLVHHDDISVWLRVGKNNGSIVDREAFKRRMLETTYRTKFFSLLTSLPDSFYIAINGEYKGVKLFKTPDELYEFVRHDDINRHYFIIGTDYSPDAVEISSSNIANTVINDFGLMLPLYEQIKTII
jgi:hypothetical protein